MKKGNSSRSPYVHNQYNSSNNNMQRAGSFRGSRDHFQSRSNNTEGNGGNANVDGWNTVSSPVGDKSRNELSNFARSQV
ncbi:hypothetical protein G6F68_018944 [Rhizopus microsporus]|nr:hypothetical protein G6F68_018944 [Rhizopus microsporus]